MNNQHLRKLLRPFFKRTSAVIGLAIVLFLVIVALLGPELAGNDPAKQFYDHMLEGPSRLFPLGTDQLGRDILSRLLNGAHLSLAVAAAGVVAGAVLGIPLGLTAGYFGGWWDAFVMRVMDVLLAFPGILLAIGIIAILGPGLTNVMIAIAVFGVPQFARLVRGSTLQVKSLDFVQAAHAQGAGAVRILAKHVLPNVLAPIVVMATLRTAQAILIASSLSFLGLGATPPSPEWGSMLADGRAYIETFPHVAAFPGIAIFLTVLGFNLLGDGLNDMLDPRLRRNL
ncbi:MAG TPA: ABC transporter permease subunit [Symbiobacteriaceae bacterium]|nr:ABC transporter permease subunit [Symbiobacteriaceae bacterium]